MNTGDDGIISGRFSETDLVPLSALQHLMFCERQCALIHIEQLWKDNVLTLEGSHMHRKVDETGPRRERRGDLVISRGLPLRSLELGLSGRADVVEFHRVLDPAVGAPTDGGMRPAVRLKGITGWWRPSPVDYKRGKPKADRCDEVQLCAQALCLEEMLGGAVPEGALFYGKNQRRKEIVFDDGLRELTIDASRRLHELIESGRTPKAVKEPKCKNCSLVELCLPETMKQGRSAKAYLRRMIGTAGGEDGES